MKTTTIATKDAACAAKAEATGIEPDLPKPPETPEQLHTWLIQMLDIHVPRHAIVEGHAAPFDYLVFTFFEGQFESVQPNQPAPTDCVLWANRGGGKTMLGAIATLLDLLYKPAIAVRVLAGSIEQSGRMMAHLHRFFSTNEVLAAMVKGKLTDKRIELTNKSEVEVLAQSQTSVRGTHVQKLRCDEVDLFDVAVWEAAQFVTKSKQCGPVFVRGSVECLSTMHQHFGVMHRLIADVGEGKRTLFKWGVVDVLERCGEGRKCEGEPQEESGRVVPLRVLQSSPGDAGCASNAPEPGVREPQGSPPQPLPQGGAPERYGSLAAPCPLWAECKGAAKARGDAGHLRIEDAIAMKGRVGEEAWETEMLCTRVRMTGAVFPGFDPRRHVFCGSGPQRVREWLAGMDFGIRAPTVVLWAALDEDGAIYVMDERHKSGVVLDEHIEAMRAGLGREGIPPWPPVRWVAADPAGNHKNAQSGVSDTSVLRKSGFQVRTPHESVLRGLAMISARLTPAAGWPRLFVHERCRELIRSLKEYRYKEGELENLEPLKDGSDHAIDALRYLVVSVDKPENGKSESYLGR
jgi:hypothetical protein